MKKLMHSALKLPKHFEKMLSTLFHHPQSQLDYELNIAQGIWIQKENAKTNTHAILF